MIRPASSGIYISGLLRGPLTRPRRADGSLALRAVHRRRLGALGDVDPVALQSLAQAIQNQEGFFPGSLAYKNNNPGNLVYAGQSGASPGAGGFARFNSYQDGYNALLAQINLDANRGTDVNGNPTQTVSQLITSWAPPGQNDTAAYIQSVTSQTGFDASDNLLGLGVSSDAGSATPMPAAILMPDFSVAAVEADTGLSAGQLGLGAAALVGLLLLFR
jgi:hypothetical protein